MFKRYLLVSLTALSAQQLAAQSELVQDRIAGAILGAVIGDALARPIDHFDTTKEIQTIYPGGLTTVKNFTPIDWVTDSSGKKIAASTANTVLASLVVDTCSEGRRLHKSAAEIADTIARKLVDVFGPHALKLDPLFGIRGYTAKQLSAGQQLSTLLTKNSGELWWNHQPLDGDSKFQLDIAEESDSGALMRAWPLGIVFADNLKMVKECAELVTMITHRHPTARAAATALAVGIASSLQGSPVEDVINNMVRAAESYEPKERLYKKGVRKIRTRKGYTTDAISTGKMFTSDMIRYAGMKAKEGLTPLEILGDTSKQQDNHRSFRGYLLGNEADEAVAAAVYILACHPNDLKAALTMALNMPGRSALVASIVGALVGARTGQSQLEADFGYELSVLEKGLIPDSTEELAGIIHDTPVQDVSAQTTISSSSYRKWALLGVAAATVTGWYLYTKFFKKTA